MVKSSRRQVTRPTGAKVWRTRYPAPERSLVQPASTCTRHFPIDVRLHQTDLQPTVFLPSGRDLSIHIAFNSTLLISDSIAANHLSLFGPDSASCTVLGSRVYPSLTIAIFDVNATNRFGGVIGLPILVLGHSNMSTGSPWSTWTYAERSHTGTRRLSTGIRDLG
jgi:hypothetical protein